MVGEGGRVDDRTIAEVATSMRRLLAAIDEGEVSASDTQRSYLAGAADVLDELTGQRPPDDFTQYGSMSDCDESYERRNIRVG